MTVRQDAVEAVVKIRPGGLLWIPFFGLWVAFVALAASELPSSSRWAATAGLLIGCFCLAVGLLLRGYGIDLTAECAIVRELGPRSIPWREVRAVVLNDNPADPSVKLTFVNDEPFSLPYLPRTPRQKGQAPYERDFALIHQWWIAQRGESGGSAPAE